MISEDMRATLNAFLYRTGEQSNKWVQTVISTYNLLRTCQTLMLGDQNYLTSHYLYFFQTRITVYPK